MPFASKHPSPRWHYVEGGCIEWAGSHVEGYANVNCQSVWRTTSLLHRLVYEYVHGPQGRKVVHHECGNRGCINLSHLRAVTHREHRRIHPRDTTKS